MTDPIYMRKRADRQREKLGFLLIYFADSVNALLTPQGLETYFNMHKYTKLLTFLTKIRTSEYKHIHGIVLHGGQFAYRPRSNRVFSKSVQCIFEM